MFKNPTNDEANVEVSRDREREREKAKSGDAADGVHVIV